MSCQNQIILKAENVFRAVAKNGMSIKTVNGISYEFHKGTIYNIVGPSGSGKTSFLRLLNRLDDPTEGLITFRDKPLDLYPPTELRQKVSMLFQSPYLFEGTVRENLKYCCQHDDKPINDILPQVGLKADIVDKQAEDISGGEKQRVALARALLLNPEILLLDEPTASLDPTLSQSIEKLILRLTEDLCLTTIMVTHDPEQARRLGGHTLLLVEGKLVETGPTERVLNNPETDLARKYINRELI